MAGYKGGWCTEVAETDAGNVAVAEGATEKKRQKESASVAAYRGIALNGTTLLTSVGRACGLTPSGSRGQIGHARQHVGPGSLHP